MKGQAKLCAFKTNVVLGEALKALKSEKEALKQRRQIKILEKYIKEEVGPRVCILYGLKETGKTTLLFQLLSKIDLDKTAFIFAKNNDSMRDIICDIKCLYEMGVKIVLIDDILKVSHFFEEVSVLSDIYCALGMKIIITGDNSYMFEAAKRDTLYDRTITVRTTYISYQEYAVLNKDATLESYLEKSGPQFLIRGANEQCVQNYLEEAVCKNIEETLNYKQGRWFLENAILVAHEQGILSKIIKEVIRRENLLFMKTIAEDDQIPEIEAELNKISIENGLVKNVKTILKDLDLLNSISKHNDDGHAEEITIFNQPGLRFCLLKTMCESLFGSNSNMLQAIKEKLMAEAIAMHLMRKYKTNNKIFLGNTDNKKNFIINYYSQEKSFDFLHICYSRSATFITDKEVEALQWRFLKNKEKAVVYLGMPCKCGDWKCVNAESILTK